MSSYTVSSLPEYIEQNKSELLHASIVGAQTLTYPIDIITGIKHKQTLNFTSITAPFQAGGTCAFNASGDTTFTQSTITVTDVKVENQFCPKELEEKYTQKYLRPGVKQEVMPLEQYITGIVNEKIASQMEQCIWQGNTAFTFDSNLKQFDGLIKAIDAATPTYATATADVTTSNIIGILQDMYSSAPANILSKDLVYIMGKDTFRLLVIALGNANLYHVPVNQGLGNWELIFPYFNIKVIGVDGLNNITNTTSTYKDRIFLTYWDNLYFATDLQNDSENYEMWYSKDDRVIKMSVEWKAGAGVKFGSEVVTYKNS